MICRWFLSLGLILVAAGTAAADQATRFGAANATAQLTIWGATDLDELRPAIEGFLARNPAVAISYHDLQSTSLYERIRAGGATPPDLAISSAADLQIKLVNDGFAREHTLPKEIRLPEWAAWRNQAFGISAEPAVMVFHRSLTRLGPLPRSRAELSQMLADNLATLDGRVATYDIEQSGLGYLFASQDSLYATTYTTLLRSLSRARTRLYCCSGEILDAIEQQTALVGYNILGSYALSRQQRGAPIEIIPPDDYTLVLSRVALIPRNAKRPDLSGAFLDFLLSPEIQQRLSHRVSDRAEPMAVSHPIALNAALLVYLDSVKRERFIKAWKALIGSGEVLRDEPR